jgi:hypothetical protein
MPTPKNSVRGQVVLPAVVRAAKARQASIQFEVVSSAQGVLRKALLPVGPFAPTRPGEVYGMATYSGPILGISAEVPFGAGHSLPGS